MCIRDRIHVAGKQIGADADFPESLGMIIENPGFLPNLSGVTNLKRLAKIRGNITEEDIRSSMPVSYTHLDVYKRQV